MFAHGLGTELGANIFEILGPAANFPVPFPEV
jgi:hypothetical protein